MLQSIGGYIWLWWLMKWNLFFTRFQLEKVHAFACFGSRGSLHRGFPLVVLIVMSNLTGYLLRSKSHQGKSPRISFLTWNFYAVKWAKFFQNFPPICVYRLGRTFINMPRLPIVKKNFHASRELSIPSPTDGAASVLAYGTNHGDCLNKPRYWYANSGSNFRDIELTIHDFFSN